MIERLGFEGGRVLEPAVGVGNFFSTMPRSLMDKSQLTGIELDRLTARMAAALHPQANIRQMGYQRSETPDSFYDLIISNVPFANVTISDRRYDNLKPSVHNYFFLKAVDQVRPGGIVAFLTSSWTMDGQKAARIRAEIAKKADLVKAVRLPGETFKEYAGTKVVADLIILRKRVPGEPDGTFQGQAWKSTVPFEKEGQTVNINEYWESNPGDVLGELSIGTGTTFGTAGMIVNRQEGFAAQLNDAVESIPVNVMTSRQANREFDSAVANQTDARQQSVVEQDGDFFVVRGEHLVPIENVLKRSPWVKSAAKTEKRKKALRAAIAMRDGLAEVLDMQRQGKDAAEARRALNVAFDEFKALDEKSTLSESNLLKMMIRLGDPMARAVRELEQINPDGTTQKRPIFVRETTRGRKPADQLSVGDAYAVHHNDSPSFDSLDIAAIAKLAKTDEAEVIESLTRRDAIYRSATGVWQPADVFLSGNVRRKLREARAAQAEGVPDLDRSIDALEQVIPADVPYTDIEVNLGASWGGEQDYRNFVSTLLNIDPSDEEVRRLANQ